ncbi:carotenoid biosynthesis protein [Mucilaginibacter sp.]|uniref:carotenoid biosynthesis protein n=1 Tax=Mucilaginibacter sp. TaxID=1882438 RepID=UPI0031B603D0
MFNYAVTPKDRIAVIIIILFHVVGFIGFIIPPFDAVFLNIVPWHLLLMAAVILYSHKQDIDKLAVFALLIFFIGFMAEYIGVHTGWLFGNYAYGETLGIKLFNIPLMIGINWFLLIYATGVSMRRSRMKNMLARIVIGALVLVLLDILIEPIAIHFDYWHWTGGSIPVKNYVCWFLLSALLLFIFEQFKFKRQSIVAIVLLVMQFVFFMGLGIFN